MNFREALIEESVVVASDAASYIGQPFEGGAWSFDGGRELLVAALETPCSYQSRGSVDPYSVRRGRAAWQTWRSRDGGSTWQRDAVLHRIADTLARLEEGGIEPLAHGLTVPDSKRLMAMLSVPVGQHLTAGIFVSPDRGGTWQGPNLINGLSLSFKESYAESAILPREDGSLLLFATSRHPNNIPRPAVMLLSGAESYLTLLSYLPHHVDMERRFPSPVRLPDGRIVVAVTQRMAEAPGHTLIFSSDDDGRTWESLQRVNDIGDPAHLLALRDGRLLLTYGVPLPPYRLVARLSEDGGASWSEAYLLREGGGSADLGSARTIERADGTLVTLYQWNDADDEVIFSGGRRYLAALLWRPQ